MSVDTRISPVVEGSLGGDLRRRRRIAASLAVVLVYVLLGVGFFWPDLRYISRNVFSSATLGDPQLSLWELAWVQHALLHGLNPFFSRAIFVPTGMNLAANTSAPLLGLLTLPLAPFLGPVAILNLIAVAAMPLSAISAFFVLRKWKVWLPAAAIGGLVYGFGPSMIGQNLDLHIYLTFLPLPPLIAATVVSILQRKGSPWRLGVQLGALIAAQYLIMPEIAAVVVVLGVVAVAFVAIRRLAMVPGLAMPVARSALIAGVVALSLLAYPVWMLVAGSQHVPTPPHPPYNPYNRNDLLNFVAPGPTQLVSFGMRSLGNRVDRYITGENSYIGIPVLVVLGYLLYRSWRVARVQLSLALLFVCAILTLGPYLVVDGHHTRFPLPFWVIDHMPFLQSIIPPRLAFGVDTCLAALMAFSVDEVARQRTSLRHDASRQGRMPALHEAALAVIVLMVLVGTQLPRWPSATAPAVTLPSQIRQAIPAGDPVAVTYPYATYFRVQSMAWQVDADFDFRLLGGYGFHPWPKGAEPNVYINGYIGFDRPLEPAPMSPAGLQRLLANQEGIPLYGPTPRLSSSLVDETRTTLSKYGTKVVIVDRSAAGSGPVVDLFSMALGPPTATAQSFVLWDVGSR